MSSAFQHPIARIETLTQYRLRVWWRAGGQSVVDFSDDIANGPVWEPLQDERMFATVRLVDRGTVIQWPEPVWNGAPLLEVDADGLWHMAREQNLPVAAE